MSNNRKHILGNIFRPIMNGILSLWGKRTGVMLMLSCLHLPLLVLAEDYICLEKEELHGPVKIVFEEKRNSAHSSSIIGLTPYVQNGNICYFDSMSRKCEYYECINEDMYSSEWVTYAKNDSSLHIFFDANWNPCDSIIMCHYNAQGKVYHVNHLYNHMLYYRDSLVYDNSGRLTAKYIAYTNAPLFLQQEYTYDAQDNLLGMRSYRKDGILCGGFDVERIGNEAKIHYFDKSSPDSSTKKWDDIIRYNKDGHIVKVITNQEEYTYSHFDNHGNWTRCERVAKNRKKSPQYIIRRIEYWGEPEDAIAVARNQLQHKAGARNWDERLTDTVKHKPLIVCDGVVVDAYPQSAKDVASVKSLDSKEAMRLYGEQGKNGAIVFTTNDFVAQTGDSTAVAEQVAVADENNTQDDLQAIRLKWRLASFIAVCFMFIPVVIALIVLLYDRIRGDKVSPAPLRMRFADNALDSLFLALLQAVVILCFVHSTVFSILLMSSHSQYFWRMILSLLQLGGYFLYYFICEYYWGATLGKKLCRLKVVNEDGTKPSSKTIVQRTLSRFLPFELISFFFTDKDENGNMTRMWHDVLSNTRVVRDNPTINNEK